MEERHIQREEQLKKYHRVSAMHLSDSESSSDQNREEFVILSNITALTVLLNLQLLKTKTFSKIVSPKLASALDRIKSTDRNVLWQLKQKASIARSINCHRSIDRSIAVNGSISANQSIAARRSIAINPRLLYFFL